LYHSARERNVADAMFAGGFRRDPRKNVGEARMKSHSKLRTPFSCTEPGKGLGPERTRIDFHAAIPRCNCKRQRARPIHGHTGQCF